MGGIREIEFFAQTSNSNDRRRPASAVAGSADRWSLERLGRETGSPSRRADEDRGHEFGGGLNTAADASRRQTYAADDYEAVGALRRFFG